RRSRQFVPLSTLSRLALTPQSPTNPAPKPPPFSPLPILGWREWVAFPDLALPRIKAKIDTGARSSALHAFDVKTWIENDQAMVRFKVHPYQRDSHRTIGAIAPLLERRPVRSSNGHVEERPVIQTTIVLGGQSWPLELTLTNRDVMGFRMLLGRQAIRHRFLIDPGRSFIQSPAP
ncbi:ATP-dependent zinc protease family protein, partial [Prochlorothrix hollandica]|uniref:ATP-dependent zinc protease family protein n=1 Tax=Prochlorothrix hollandica TaxID=1223 RepID=UPI003DA719DC